MPATSFGIAETDNYVRNILAKAGKMPKGADANGITDWLLPHVIHQESGGNPNAVSPVGARGTMQLMPATARMLEQQLGMPAGETDRNPDANVAAGKHYLNSLVKRYPGRPDLALAAYNAGPARADKWSGVQLSAFRKDAGVDGQVPLENVPDPLPIVDRNETDARGNYFSNIVGLDWSVGAAQRIFEDSGYAPDPNFDLSKIPAKQWQQITQGIPEELQPKLGSAVSMAHLQLLAMRTRGQLQAEQELAHYGGWGIAGRFAVDLADPLGIALGVASGGFGTLSKAGRLAEAVKAATAGERFAEAHTALDALGIAAREGSPMGHAARSAVLAGGTNAAMQEFLNQGNITRDGWDVALAGLTGGILGAAASKVFHGGELADLRTAYLREKQSLELAELDHHIRTQRADLETKLKWLHADGDVAQARAELDALQKHADGLRATYARDLADAATTRREALTKTAAGALKRSELGRLRRSVEGLRKQAVGHDELLPQIQERMLQEDIASMGEAEATSKARTKLRNGAAKKEAAARMETVRSNLQHGETALARATAAQDALHELRTIERRARVYPGDHLQQLDEPGRNAFGERELALAKHTQELLDGGNAKLKVAQDNVAAKRLSLESQLANLEKVRQAGVKASDRSVIADAESFGMDTASSARFMGFYEGVHPNLEGEDHGLPVVAQMGAQGLRGKIVDKLMARKGPMATVGMILRGSPNEKVRTLLGRIVGNSVGTKDGSANTTGASEFAQIMRQRTAAKFYSAVTPAYRDWAERNGVGLFGRQTRAPREQFMQAVGRFIRGDEEGADPAVAKAASTIRGIFDQYRAEAKAAGVKGFENLEPNPHYLPRVFDFAKQFDTEKRIGSDNMRLLTQRAIQSANEDMPDNIAQIVARAYVKRMKELRVGSDVGLLQGMKWDDVAFLRQFLDEAGVGRDEINSVVDQMALLNANRERQTEGSFRNAKHRVQFDENLKMRFKDQVAAREGRDETMEVSMADMFENNAEHLFGRYNRTVSGHIGLAKVGIKSRADFDESLRVIERELEDDPKELERVKKTAQVSYQLVTGQPIEDANTLTRLGRAARDWNFTTTMGQSGWAQFPDLAGLLQSGYLKHTMRYFPEVFGTAKRDAAGHIDIPFYREMEEWVGLGTDLHNNQVFSAFDPIENEGMEGALGHVEHGLRVGGRAVQMASGLGWMTSFSQRIVGRVIIQRLMKDVLEGGALAEHRAMHLGLTGDMKARIAQQIKDHTEFANGDFGGTVKVLNYGAWKDVDAREALLNAVSREARRMVQEEDLGDTTIWMHKNWGKILTQFRRFAMVSYSKQLLHGIAHADAEEFTRVMVSMALAAAAYQARHMVKIGLMEAGGASDADIQKYKDNMLGVHRLAAASIANSTYSTLLPGLWDTAQWELTGTRSFDTRSSGLGSDLITGNPTYSLGHGALQAFGGAAQALIRGDRQYDKKDAAAFRRITPFGNVIGMDLPYAALTSGLPESDQDPDPSHLDWLFNDHPK
jgi:hypothetical protein